MLTNYWFIGCATSRLGNDPVATKINDEELVLFRDGAGVAHALADRCCHRGFRLSCGKVHGDRIECGFHGWQYEGDGRCARLPSLRDGQPIKDFYRVPSFSCVEKDGYVWVWVGDEKPSYQPSVPFFEEGRWTQGALAMDCESMRAIEINLDSTHVRFVHPSHPYTIEVTAQGGAMQDSEYETRVTDTGVVMFWPPTERETDPTPTADFIAFDLPDRVLLASAVPHMGTIYIILHFVPTGSRSCRMEYSMTQFNPTVTEKTQWIDEVPEIFAEDKRILETIQSAYDRQGTAFEKSVEADFAPLLARQAMKLAEKGKWPSERATLGARRIVKLRM